MNRIFLIIQREYLSRVKKKSFLIMTFVGPILMAALFVVPALLANQDSEQEHVLVLDKSTMFLSALEENSKVIFTYLPDDTSLDSAKEMVDGKKNYALLYIPMSETGSMAFLEENIQLYTKKQPSLGITGNLRRQMEKEIQRRKLAAKGIDFEMIDSVKSDIDLSTLILGEDGNEKEGSAERSMGLGFIGGLLIYMFIFIYGVQVMRGVIEEKTNRIVEVIISSIKPFQLMLGKIIGIAAVGLTQFLLWVILTIALVSVVQMAFLPDPMDTAEIANGAGQTMQLSESQETARDIMDGIQAINFPLIIGMFLFYFLGGYLLYSSLFAAVGSAVDGEADTQQFMMPITIPLILSFVVGSSIIDNPDGPLAFWFSIIPLTSPIVMMIRIPFGVPVPELLLSMSLLVLGFLGTTWLAARIYRVGILMYGKKVNYAELLKWIRYKG